MTIRTTSLSILLAGLMLASAPLVHAQGMGVQTRQQVTMDRDTFLKLMRYDEATGMWVLRSGMTPPAGILSRADVIAMRDQFLTMNAYDEAVGTWVPLSKPRDMSTMTRDQINTETVRFLMMHRFDEDTNQWVSKLKPMK